MKSAREKWTVNAYEQVADLPRAAAFSGRTHKNAKRIVPFEFKRSCGGLRR